MSEYKCPYCNEDIDWECYYEILDIGEFECEHCKKTIVCSREVLWAFEKIYECAVCGENVYESDDCADRESDIYQDHLHLGLCFECMARETAIDECVGRYG